MTIRAYKFNNVGVETPNQSDVDDPYLPADPVNTTILNNQASAVDLTGMLIDKDDYQAADIVYTIERKSSSENYQTMGRMFLKWDSADSLWRITTMAGMDDPEIMGVYFTITTGGQVRYTSSSLGGTGYVGEFRSLVTKMEV